MFRGDDFASASIEHMVEKGSGDSQERKARGEEGEASWSGQVSVVPHCYLSIEI